MPPSIVMLFALPVAVPIGLLIVIGAQAVLAPLDSSSESRFVSGFSKGSTPRRIGTALGRASAACVITQVSENHFEGRFKCCQNYHTGRGLFSA